MKRMIVLLALALAVAPTRADDLTITDDPGGELGAFVQKYLDLAFYGGRVRIAGPCASACALVTGIVPRDRICVTKAARLGFHSASVGRGRYSAYGTLFMWNTYPPEIQQMVRKRGWNGLSPHPRMIYIESRALRSLFKAC